MVVLTGQPSKTLEQFVALADGLSPLPAELEPPAGVAQQAPAGRRARLRQEQVAELVQQYESGTEIHELAREWSLHRATVARLLRTAGVGQRQRGLTSEQLEEACQLYGVDWPLSRLAERYGCAAETVRRGLLKQGVELRDPWVARRSP